MGDAPSVAAERSARRARRRARRPCVGPSPVTVGGRRTDAATTSPPITTMRRSSPVVPLLEQHLGADRSRRGDRARRGRRLVDDPDGDAPPLLAPCRLHDDLADARARNARSSASKVLSRPAGTRSPARCSTARVRPLWSQRRKATALRELGQRLDGADRRLAVGQHAARRSTGSSDLDGDAAAERLVDDDLRVAVGVVVARRVVRRADQTAIRRRRWRASAESSSRGPRLGGEGRHLAVRRPAAPPRPASRTARRCRACRSRSSGCHCTPTMRSSAPRPLDALDDAVVSHAPRRPGRRRARRRPGGAAC